MAVAILTALFYSLIATGTHNNAMALQDTIVYQEAEPVRVQPLNDSTPLVTADKDSVILNYVTDDNIKEVIYNKRIRLGAIYINDSDESYVIYHKAERFKRWTTYLLAWFIGDYDYVDVYIPNLTLASNL